MTKSFKNLRKKMSFSQLKKSEKLFSKMEKEILEGLEQAVKYLKGDKSVGTEYIYEVQNETKYIKESEKNNII